MSYIKKTLTEDEKIIVFRKYHWIFWLWPIILCVLFFMPLLTLLIITFFHTSTSHKELPFAFWVFFFLLSIILIKYLIKYISTESSVTNKRIIFKTGFIRTNTDELRNTKLENIQIKQSLLGRIFSYGNLEFRGTGGSPVIFKTIPDPISLKKEIENNLYKL